MRAGSSQVNTPSSRSSALECSVTSCDQRLSLAIASVPLEVLDFAFVLLRGLLAVEGAEVPALADLLVLAARVDAVFPGFELADHDAASAVKNEQSGVRVRSAERRVGKGCVGTGISRWSPCN